MKPRIRKATPVDIRATLTLWRDVGAEPTHTDDMASLRKLLDLDPSALIVADEHDADATGFWGSTDWHLQPERLRYVRG
jgi:hypothetical protein